MSRLIFLGCLLGTVIAVHPPFDEIFEWNYISYNWPLSDFLQQTNLTEGYIAENNAIAGIKLWKNKMYLTIPRWKNGVPVTLAVTSATPLNGINAPKLNPYPNWEMQALGNCSALQSVQSMEIDPLGRMWVLDSGKTETMTVKPVATCPPRLVILDLENNGAVLRSYQFPNDIAPRESAQLNDIVLDHEDGGLAFITDAGRDDPGIIVYSLKDNKSWKVRHNSMKVQEAAVSFEVASIRITKPVNIDGIALSPPGPNRVVYYSPLSSLHLYSIPTSVLKNSSVENVDEYVIDLGSKQSQTDGMVMTNRGILYLGLLNEDAVGIWNSTAYPGSVSGIRPIVRDHDHMKWLDTFAIDEEGRLWCVTNSLQNFITNHVDKSRPNYRVMRSLTRAKNYQYFSNGLAPKIPEISEIAEITEITETPAAANRMNLALSTCWIIALLSFAR